MLASVAATGYLGLFKGKFNFDEKVKPFRTGASMLQKVLLESSGLDRCFPTGGFYRRRWCSLVLGGSPPPREVCQAQEAAQGGRRRDTRNALTQNLSNFPGLGHPFLHTLIFHRLWKTPVSPTGQENMAREIFKLTTT